MPILSEAELIHKVLLPCHEALDAATKQQLLQYIVAHWHTLQADAELTTALAETAFVPVACSGSNLF